MFFRLDPYDTSHTFLTIDDVAPTTLSIFGTAQFSEAKNADYRGFKPSHLASCAYRILQIQCHLLYRWCLVRYLMDHSIKGNLVRQKCFDVTPDCFQPTEDDIQLYIENPKFLWRFSKRNYSVISKLFHPGNLHSSPDSFLHSYNKDVSAIMPYLTDKNNRVKLGLKKKFKLLKEINYSFCDINKYKAANTKYFKFCLNYYECSEFLYSDDFHLHMMDGDTSYDEFVSIILTGKCERYICQLYSLQIDSYNKELQLLPNRRKKEKIKDEFLVKSKHINDKNFASIVNNLSTIKDANSLGSSIRKKCFSYFDKQTNSATNEYISNKGIGTCDNTDTLTARELGVLAAEKENIGKKRSNVKLRNSNHSEGFTVSASSSVYSNIGLTERKQISFLNPLSFSAIHMYTSEKDEFFDHPYILPDIKVNEKNVFVKPASFHPCSRSSSLLETPLLTENMPIIDKNNNQKYNYIKIHRMIRMKSAQQTIPENALPYFGKVNYEHSEYIIDHLKLLVEDSKRKNLIRHPLYSNTNWVDDALCAVNYHPCTFYRFANVLFNGACNANQFRFIENGMVLRKPWKLPCPAKRTEILVQKYLVQLPKDEWIHTHRARLYATDESFHKKWETVRQNLQKLIEVHDVIFEKDKKVRFHKKIVANPMHGYCIDQTAFFDNFKVFSICRKNQGFHHYNLKESCNLLESVYAIPGDTSLIDSTCLNDEDTAKINNSAFLEDESFVVDNSNYDYKICNPIYDSNNNVESASGNRNLSLINSSSHKNKNKHRTHQVLQYNHKVKSNARDKIVKRVFNINKVSPKLGNIKDMFAINPIASSHTDMTFDFCPYVEKFDFCGIFCKKYNFSDITNVIIKRKLNKIHISLMEVFEKRFEFLHFKISQKITNCEYKNEFKYDKFKYVNQILFDACAKSNKISPKVIPFDLFEFENTYEFKRNIAMYLTLYFVKHSPENMKWLNNFEEVKFQLQCISTQHAKFVYLVARDRYLSELFTVSKYIEKIKMERPTRKDIIGLDHFTVMDNYAYDFYYTDFIRIINPSFFQKIQKIRLAYDDSTKYSYQPGKSNVTNDKKSPDLNFLFQKATIDSLRLYRNKFKNKGQPVRSSQGIKYKSKLMEVGNIKKFHYKPSPQDEDLGKFTQNTGNNKDNSNIKTSHIKSHEPLINRESYLFQDSKPNFQEDPISVDQVQSDTARKTANKIFEKNNVIESQNKSQENEESNKKAHYLSKDKTDKGEKQDLDFLDEIFQQNAMYSKLLEKAIEDDHKISILFEKLDHDNIPSRWNEFESNSEELDSVDLFIKKKEVNSKILEEVIETERRTIAKLDKRKLDNVPNRWNEFNSDLDGLNSLNVFTDKRAINLKFFEDAIEDERKIAAQLEKLERDDMPSRWDEFESDFESDFQGSENVDESKSAPNKPDSLDLSQYSSEKPLNINSPEIKIDGKSIIDTFSNAKITQNSRACVDDGITNSQIEDKNVKREHAMDDISRKFDKDLKRIVKFNPLKEKNNKIDTNIDFKSFSNDSPKNYSNEKHDGYHLKPISCISTNDNRVKLKHTKTFTNGSATPINYSLPESFKIQQSLNANRLGTDHQTFEILEGSNIERISIDKIMQNKNFERKTVEIFDYGNENAVGVGNLIRAGNFRKVFSNDPSKVTLVINSRLAKNNYYNGSVDIEEENDFEENIIMNSDSDAKKTHKIYKSGDSRDDITDSELVGSCPVPEKGIKAPNTCTSSIPKTGCKNKLKIGIGE